jgi:hypothetical protein
MKLIAGLSLLGAISGCGIDPENYVGISYDTYAAQIGTDQLDPKGATRISYKLAFDVDGYDQWYDVLIPEPDYDALLTSRMAHLSNSQRAAYMAKPVGQVTLSSTHSLTAPNNWPSMEGVPPSWWSPHEALSVECTFWHLQCQTRGKGWQWIYDRSRERLWIWEWNYQHHRF